MNAGHAKVTAVPRLETRSSLAIPACFSPVGSAHRCTGWSCVRHTAVVTEDFANLVAGRRYVAHVSPGGIWLRGAYARAAAHLPMTPGGEVSSAAGCWQVAAERQGRGWVVVARDLVREEPVGCAYMRWWLKAFDLWVAPEQDYRLREKPFSGTWILRGELGEIARFTSGRERAIVLAKSVSPDPKLALVILLAHEAIRYSALFPTGAAAGVTP